MSRACVLVAVATALASTTASASFAANATLAHRALESCSIQANIDFEGNDIGGAQAANAGECCDKCRALDGCRAFSWTAWNGGSCFFKSSRGVAKRSDGVFSALVGDEQCRIESGVDYVGNDMGGVAAVTSGECCDKCSQTAGCRAFSWSAWNGGSCWLKSAKGETKRSDGVESGVVSTPPSDKCQVEQDVDYEGGDLASERASDVGECCDQCQRRNDCRAFSWTAWNGGTCFLKRSKGATKWSRGVKSGTVKRAPPSDQCALEHGVDFVGHDVGSAPGASAEDCCGLCAERSGCGAFTWSPWNGGVCFFKSHKGETRGNGDAVSGVVNANRPRDHVQYRIRRNEIPSIAVNLGSWLVGESWISWSSPAWRGADGWRGEYGVMRQLSYDRGRAIAQFEEHRQTWITERDIEQIARAGLNSVRVPVGFWIVNDDPTTWSTDVSRMYAPGALKYLDRLVNEWAVKYNIAVLLSLHAHQGSQNGFDHSAPQEIGRIAWHTSEENVQNSIQFATFLARRYKDSPAFLGMNMMNEPKLPTDQGTLERYYKTVYDQVRATGNDCILITSPMIELQGPPIMMDFMRWPQYNNVWHEFHIYYLWGQDGRNEDQILEKARNYRREHLDPWRGNYMYIGEWALPTPSSAPFNSYQRLRDFAWTMLDQFKGAHGGHAFWTWRHDDERNTEYCKWSLRRLLEKNIMSFN
ncbi:hypothetical protein PINS_up014809 [Pythium insidiosum]|nr:hypothetical protein PINS_up014809 [Pythium insidiosum]